jgi:FlaA1/EpsC-like NDP-sugar epimerase
MNRYEMRMTSVEDYLNKLSIDKKTRDHYSGRSILVTGGAGAVGSNLIIALSILVGGTGKVVVLDNLSAIKIKDP